MNVYEMAEIGQAFHSSTQAGIIFFVLLSLTVSTLWDLPERTKKLTQALIRHGPLAEDLSRANEEDLSRWRNVLKQRILAEELRGAFPNYKIT